MAAVRGRAVGFPKGTYSTIFERFRADSVAQRPSEAINAIAVNSPETHCHYARCLTGAGPRGRAVSCVQGFGGKISKFFQGPSKATVASANRFSRVAGGKSTS